jgi:hypothetical protein
MDKSRASAVAALFITGLAIVYTVAFIAGWRPSWGWLAQATIHIGELLAVVALALTKASARSRVARVGLAAAIVGQLTIAAAEVVSPSCPDLANVLFAISPILTGAGLITTGLATIRARAWAGPSRFLPFTLGLYTILVLIPMMIGSGGPPAPLALVTIMVWDLIWFALSIAVLSQTRSAVLGDPAPAKVTIR